MQPCFVVLFYLHLRPDGEVDGNLVDTTVYFSLGREQRQTRRYKAKEILTYGMFVVFKITAVVAANIFVVVAAVGAECFRIQTKVLVISVARLMPKAFDILIWQRRLVSPNHRSFAVNIVGAKLNLSSFNETSLVLFST